MKISAGKINYILQKYGYHLTMDKIHDEEEIKKYGAKEKNFNEKTYLTIKSKNIVIGRIYQIHSYKNLDLRKIMLQEQHINIILAFFKYFEIPQAKKVVNSLSKLTKMDIQKISVELIRNNVLKQAAY